METMKILFLGYEDSPLINYLRSLGDEVLVTSDKINPAFINENGIEFIVSYGYRHIIKSDVIKTLPDKIIKLHIALLPWNRGADPNFWSFAENTPKGVTIHYIDTGIDTGDIIAQKEVNLTNNDETLKSTYEHLQKEIQELFISHWPKIRVQKCSRHKQTGPGSIHFLNDREKFLHLLTAGWDTPTSDIYGLNPGKFKTGINLMVGEFIVRRAGPEDAKRIWEIRNHPLSRRDSLNTEEIPLVDHVAWFSRKYLENRKDHCCVLEIDRKAVGYCRLDSQDDKYIVSIAIDPNYHGRGLGTTLLSESLRQFNTKKIVLATVRKGNPASLRIFEKNGFITIVDDATSIYLKKS